MSPTIPDSACNSLRSGLCIDIPTLAASSLERSEILPTSRALSADTFSMRSGTKPAVMRTSSEPNSNASNMGSSSGSHLLRSSTGMQGLLLAETGGGLVELDLLGGGSGFKQGTAVVPGLVTPGGTSGAINPLSAPRANLHSKRVCKVGGTQRLNRHATLLSKDVTPARNAAELKSLLGNSKSKIKSGAKLLPPSNLSHLRSASDSASAVVTLEQGKSRARVEVDILLDSELCVEGGYLTGRLHVRVRKLRAKEAVVLMAGGKMRIVGFEGIPDNNDRHTFYQHAAPLSAISASSHILYSSGPDEEGFSQASEGQHVVPFAMKLSISEDIHIRAKGPFDNRSGVLVKYIAIASFKLKDPDTSEHSIAHFYRSCEIYPYFNSTLILAPAVHPLLSAAARSVFLGGPGKLKLTANLHRNVWVAGQRCFVGIAVDNESKKAVKGLTLSLIRTTTIFRSRPHLDVTPSSSADADACQTTTTRKLVAETTLEAGPHGLRGHVTEKGWWVGVDAGVRVKFTHFILLPHDTLSIIRSRLVEVSYAIRVSLIAGSLSSEVAVMLPLRIISNLSIDPPPSYPSPFNHPGIHSLVPPLLVPAVDSETASSNLPRGVNPLGDKSGAIGMGGRTDIFDEAIARGGVPASDAAIANALHGGATPRRKSHIMPRLEEEDPDIEDTGHYSSVVSSCPRSDASVDSRFYKSQDGSVGEGYSDDSGANVMDEETVDDFTMDLLRSINLNEEAGSFVGTAGLNDHDIHNLKTAAELYQTEDYLDNEPRTIISIKNSAVMSKRHRDPQLFSSRLTGKLAPSEEFTAIAAPRTILRLNVPDIPSSIRSADGPGQTAEPDHGSSELDDRTCRNNDDDALTSSHKSQTPFSLRVEKLVAAHRAATRQANLMTAIEAERISPAKAVMHKHVSLSNQCSNLAEPQPCPPSIRCPPTLTPSISKMEMSEGTTTTAPSHSGTVRSRIAELEGRTAVSGRRNCGSIAGQIV